MKADPLVVGALVAGAAAFIAELMYLTHIAPLRADLGIQVSGLLLVVWGVLVIAVLLKKGWRYWWVPTVTSPALIGPMLLISLFVGCAVDSGACP